MAKYSRMKLFIAELNKRVKCPVCLFVPTKAPIFVCPNGHNICSECKTNSCPVCREAMGNAKNLLAATVIELIDHICPYHGCSQKMPLVNLEKHKMACEYAPVACPGDACTFTKPRNDIVRHLLEDCKNCIYPIKKCCTVPPTTNVVRIGSAPIHTTGVMEIFNWDGKFFILSIKKSADWTGKDLFMFMVGSNEDLSQYEVEISVENKPSDQVQRGKISFNYSGRPNSLHMSFRESLMGLFLTQKAVGHLGDDISTSFPDVDLVIIFRKSA